MNPSATLWAVWEGQRGQAGVAHLLQVREGDRLAGQHLVGLAGERRQRWQLLPMGQAAAQHSQAGAGQEEREREG